MQGKKSSHDYKTRIYDLHSGKDRVLTELRPSIATRSRLENALAVKDRSLEKLYQDNVALTSKCRQLEVMLASNEDRLKELEESNQNPISELYRNQDLMASKDEIIHQQKNEQATLIAQYKQQLDSKKRKIQKLHDLVRSSAQKNDSYDDGHFIGKFGALEAGIRDLVKRHFSANWETTGWEEYDSVEAVDDRDFFLGAYIATVIERELFGPDAHLLSLDEETRKRQVAGLLARQSMNVLETMEIGLTAKEAFKLLCEPAHELALALRSSRAEITWSQVAPLDSLNREDVLPILAYNIGSERPTGQPKKKILFGRV